MQKIESQIFSKVTTSGRIHTTTLYKNTKKGVDDLLKVVIQTTLCI